MKNWLGISLGDVTGVGPEVTLKALAAEASADNYNYLLIGDEGVLTRLNEKLALNLPFKKFSGYGDNGKFFVANPLTGSDGILPADLPVEVTGQGTSNLSLPTSAGEGAASDAATLARQLFQIAKRDPKLKVLPAVERELVIEALKDTANNQVHAAKLLGITRATLRKRIEKFGIQREMKIE